MTTSDTPPNAVHLSLLQTSKIRPGQQLFTFIGDRGEFRDSITASQLVCAAESVAAALRSWDVAPGDRVVLVYPPSIDFITAFVGCLTAGVIPVPVYPPHPAHLKRDVDAFSAIARDCGARLVLSNSDYLNARRLGAVRGVLKGEWVRWPDIPWKRTDRLAPAKGQPWHVPDSDSPAFLQYTSGSTGTPKGVVITHGNLSAEVAANRRDLGFTWTSRLVCWVPLYHDLGLISGVMSTLAGNGHLYFMSPRTFIERPATWFDVMSRVKATHTAAPNFALDLAVRKTTPEMRSGWDLSALQVLMCAAEPIRAATVDRFLDAFRESRLRPEAFYPAYGLAEHTVSVSMGGRSTVTLDRTALESGVVVTADEPSKKRTVTLVGCGQITKPDARVRIVDPETRRPCEAGAVGEIWVHSSTKALGYHGRPKETRATFRARIDGDDETTEYLRTGDLGFFHEGELFVAGRLKDLIIVHGRNLYPQDIEEAVRHCDPFISPRGIAAFSLTVSADDADSECLAVVVETRLERPMGDEPQQIVRAVRRRLLDTYELSQCHVIVANSGTVKKTTSGKVRRRATKESLLRYDGGAHLLLWSPPTSGPTLAAPDPHRVVALDDYRLPPQEHEPRAPHDDGRAQVEPAIHDEAVAVYAAGGRS